MKTPSKVIQCDAVRLAYTELKCEIWEDCKSGKIVNYNKKYDIDERITHWAEQRDISLARVARHAGIEPTIVTIVLGILKQIFPNGLKDILKLLNIKL